MAGQVQSSITYEPVETNEQTWKPPEKRVEVVLEPTADEAPYYPPSGPNPMPVAAPVEKKACVLNIETTGVMPFESVLISIAVADISAPENIMHFTGQDERKVLEDFFAWFNMNAFSEIIGYNVSYDYRFIFTKAMKYGMQCPLFFDAELTDVMQIMQQVKQKFVYGYNKPGKLDEWTQYFFGWHPPLTFAQVLELWKKKELQPIAEYNMKKVEATILLYALYLYVIGEISA